MRLTSGVLRTTRSLRFRLAAGYLVFFTICLIVIGGFFRFSLQVIIQNETDDALEEAWGAVKGYLQVEKYGPDWLYDGYDADEIFTVSRLQRVFLLTDPDGKPIKHMHSAIYDSIGLDSPAEIKRILRSGTPSLRTKYDHGEPYRIRSGRWTDKNQVFYLAVGRSLGEGERIIGRFTRDYFLMLPLVILVCGVLGWYVAGRALEPLNSVSRTAQFITSSNLTTQIPPRGAGDELDHLIETFNGMMERLHRSFEQIRQFSTDVSHELRTPLTVVRGQLEVALFTAKSPEQYREAMENALEDVERLSSIVRALLLLSQSETGQLVLQKSDFDLAEAVRDVADQFQIPAEGDGVRLLAETPERFPVQADRIQIDRLLSNLLSNAIKYTPAGGEVRVRLIAGPGQATLIVEDTGVGIAPEHLPHIFDRFYRVPSADPHKGLGLGLSFVAWIVKAHGGSFHVESQPGRGSRFTITVPAAAAIRPTIEADAGVREATRG